MELTKKLARNRWGDSAFQGEAKDRLAGLLRVPILLSGTDLAGISIGVEGPIRDLWNLNLYQARISNSDMRFAEIACSMNESTLDYVQLAESHLDRCLFKRATIRNCDFSGARLIANLDDSVCEQCKFRHTLFSAGKTGSEYGGRRVRFIGCDFAGATFRRVEFRASQFIDCDFRDAKFIECDLRGVKVHGGFLPRPEQFEAMDVPSWVSGSNAF